MDTYEDPKKPTPDRLRAFAEHLTIFEEFADASDSEDHDEELNDTSAVCLLLRAANELEAAWKELRDIRAAIEANPEESTLDEVVRAINTNRLAERRTDVWMSAPDVLSGVRDSWYFDGNLRFRCGVMLKHLNEMAERFYRGDLKVVDEFLQLYCLDGKRPVSNPGDPA